MPQVVLELRFRGAAKSHLGNSVLTQEYSKYQVEKMRMGFCFTAGRGSDMFVLSIGRWCGCSLLAISPVVADFLEQGSSHVIVTQNENIIILIKSFTQGLDEFSLQGFSLCRRLGQGD